MNDVAGTVSAHSLALSAVAPDQATGPDGWPAIGLSGLSVHRLATFSTGVFAIAVTLLVFQLKVPASPPLTPRDRWRTRPPAGLPPGRRRQCHPRPHPPGCPPTLTGLIHASRRRPGPIISIPGKERPPCTSTRKSSI